MNRTDRRSRDEMELIARKSPRSLQGPEEKNHPEDQYKDAAARSRGEDSSSLSAFPDRIRTAYSLSAELESYYQRIGESRVDLPGSSVGNIGIVVGDR